MIISIEQWRNFLAEINIIFLPDVKLLTSESDMTDFFIAMESSLDKITFDNINDFLNNRDYHFIFERVAKNKELHQEYILLTYFLSKRFRMSIPHRWPLPLNTIQYIYSDLGISFPYST